jgi:hypothetical protein
MADKDDFFMNEALFLNLVLFLNSQHYKYFKQIKVTCLII